MAAAEYLLDTQVALWILLGSKDLPEKVFRQRFPVDDASFIFHQTSTWEIQIKYGLGKLALKERPESFLQRSIEDSGFRYERIEDSGIFFLDRLPEIHRDPFDRLLIAHAASFGWTIITADKTFERYPVRTEFV